MEASVGSQYLKISCGGLLKRPSRDHHKEISLGIMAKIFFTMLSTGFGTHYFYLENSFKAISSEVRGGRSKLQSRDPWIFKLSPTSLRLLYRLLNPKPKNRILEDLRTQQKYPSWSFEDHFTAEGWDTWKTYHLRRCRRRMQLVFQHQVRLYQRRMLCTRQVWTLGLHRGKSSSDLIQTTGQ